MQMTEREARRVAQGPVGAAAAGASAPLLLHAPLLPQTPRAAAAWRPEAAEAAPKR